MPPWETDHVSSRGQIQIEVVPDTAKFAAKVQAELAAIMRAIKVERVSIDGDTDPLTNRVHRATKSVESDLSGTFAKLKGQAGAAGAGIGTALGIGIKVALTTAVGPAVSATVALLASIGPAAAPAIPAAVAVFGTLKVALLGVGQALKDIGDEKKFNEDLQALSPNAAKFAQQLKALLPDLNKVKSAVQDRFFVGLDKDAKSVTKTLLGPLSAGMVATAGSLNKIVDGIAKFLATSKGAAAVNAIFDVSSKVIARVSDLFVPLLSHVSDWIVKASDSGVNSAFEKAKTTIESLVAAGKNVGDIFANFFGGLGKDGPTVAAGLEKATAAVKNFLASAEAQALLHTLGDTMDRVREIALKILEDLPKLTPAVTALAQGAFTTLLDIVDKVAGALGLLGGKLSDHTTLMTNLGSAIAVTVVAVKAYQVAVIAVTAAQAAWTVAMAAFDVVMGTTAVEVSGLRLAVALLGASFAPVTAQITLAATALWGQVTAMAAAAAGYARLAIAAVVAGVQQVASLAATVAGWVALGAAQLLAAARLGIYVVATNAVKVATIAWTAIQWLLNAALTANPIGIIIVVIALLVGAIILAYTKSDTFRAIVQAAFKAVGDAAVWLWENALKPLWDGIVWGFNMVVAGAKAWWSIVVAVFDAVVAAALWLWTNFKQSFDLVVAGFQFVVAKVSAWVGQVVGFFQSLAASIGEKIGNAIDFVKSIPGKITAAIGNVGSLLKDAGSKIIQGLIDGIDGMIGKLKGKVGQAVQGIRDYLPFSPAKVGPLSGSGAPERSGMRIVEGISDGIDKQRAALRQSVAAMAGDIQAGAPTFTGPVAGGDGAAAGTTPAGGVRVWPSQPKTSDGALVLQSDGSKMGDLLVEIIAKTVRVRGGDVQKVLGKNQGGVT